MAAIGAFLSLSVASASAASWSSGYPVSVSGAVTFKSASGNVPPVTCKVEESWTAQWGAWNWRCPERTIYSYFVAPTWSSGNPGLFGGIAGPGTELNPWGKGMWTQPILIRPVINGDASQPTRMVLTNQQWGAAATPAGVATVYATGTVNFTTPTGGLTTIVP